MREGTTGKGAEATGRKSQLGTAEGGMGTRGTAVL